MLFFGKKDQQTQAPTKITPASVFGKIFAFNPHFGRSLSPLGDSFRVFILLLAQVFAALKLFPRDHKAFSNPDIYHSGLSVREVFGTAWRGLRFTREGALQVVLFFTVIGIIVTSIFAIVIFVMSMFTGRAHAGITDPFKAPSEDLANQWLTYIFPSTSSDQSINQGDIITNYLSDTGSKIPLPKDIQGALASAFATYSGAILVIAVVILFYHLTAMVAETAHHGEAMGKRFNKIWGPIRLVFALGILVPIGGGLNAGQYLVVQIAKWGSGLASTVWSGFTKVIATGNLNTYAIPPIPNVSTIAHDLTMMAACQRAFQIMAASLDDVKCEAEGKPKDQKCVEAAKTSNQAKTLLAQNVILNRRFGGDPGTITMGVAALIFGAKKSGSFSDPTTTEDGKQTTLSGNASTRTSIPNNLCGSYTIPDTRDSANSGRFSQVIGAVMNEALKAGGVPVPPVTENPPKLKTIFFDTANPEQTPINKAADHVAEFTRQCDGNYIDGSLAKPACNNITNAFENCQATNDPESQKGCAKSDATAPISTRQDFNAFMNGYHRALTETIPGAVAGALAAGINTTNDQAINAGLDLGGWATAGAWFNSLARAQGAIANAIYSNLPVTHPPDPGLIMAAISSYAKDGTLDNTESQTITLKDGRKVINPVSPTGVLVRFSQQWLSPNNNTGANAPSGEVGKCNLSGTNITDFINSDRARSGNMLDTLFGVIDRQAAINGVWKTGNDGWDSCGTPANKIGGDAGGGNTITANKFTIGIQMHTGNPFAELAQLGHANIRTAYNLFDDAYQVEKIAGKITASNALGGGNSTLRTVEGALDGLAKAMRAISLAFFTCGFMLAILVPLIPFMKFFFGTLAWVAAVMEAVIAVPLVALAHLNMEGEGLPGSSGKQAYYFIFSIFLRPVMMIFGLIAGLLVFMVAVVALNQLFTLAVIGTGGLAHGHQAFSRLMYSILYVVLLYSITNNAFSLIDKIPADAMKWMGGSGLDTARMGDVGAINQMMTMAARMGGGQLFEAAGQMPKQLSALKEQNGSGDSNANDGLTDTEVKGHIDKLNLQDNLKPQTEKGTSTASGTYTDTDEDGNTVIITADLTQKVTETKPKETPPPPPKEPPQEDIENTALQNGTILLGFDDTNKNDKNPNTSDEFKKKQQKVYDNLKSHGWKKEQIEILVVAAKIEHDKYLESLDDKKHDPAKFNYDAFGKTGADKFLRALNMTGELATEGIADGSESKSSNQFTNESLQNLMGSFEKSQQYNYHEQHRPDLSTFEQASPKSTPKNNDDVMD